MRRILKTALVLAMIGCLIPVMAMGAVDAGKKAAGKAAVGKPAATIKNSEVCTPGLESGTVTKTLYAGQHFEVGTVTFEAFSEGGKNYLKVRYAITDPNWCLTETHWYAGTEPPSKAAPGQFPYGDDNLDCVKTYEETIPLDSCAELYLAAHAVVYMVTYDGPPDLGDFALALPEQVSITVASPGTGGASYFDTTVTGGTGLDGTYAGWCIDTSRTITPGITYTAKVYSSYEALPSGLVDKPQNLDLVNWIINQGFVGTPAPTPCSGAYTYGDVQRAIWTLIDDANSTSGLGPYSQCRVDQIVAAALANGEGFEPGCYDTVAVILVPVNASGAVANQVIIAQVTFIEVGIPCDPVLGEDETAWAKGACVFKQGWGSYFYYDPCPQ